jgi:hypothetical protein
MSTSTEVLPATGEPIPESFRRHPQSVMLFNGASVDDVTLAATEVAARFSDIVKRQRMFKRIGDRDHILIEAWQTIATLTGVAAVEDGGVHELPWPDPDRFAWAGEEPPPPGLEPRDRSSDEWRTWKGADELRKTFEHHLAITESYTLGRAWGYSAAYHALRDRRQVAAGEGRVNRSERTWASRDDYSLASMAQTRGQSRALGAALRFIVKLAGYEPTLPDDGADVSSGAPSGPATPYGELTDDDAQIGQAASAIKRATGLEGEAFVAALGQKFDGVPLVAVTTLRGLATFVEKSRAAAEPADEVIT